MTNPKLLCYRCFHPWANGEGKMKKHDKLRDKIEVCPKCGCMWRFNEVSNKGPK